MKLTEKQLDDTEPKNDGIIDESENITEDIKDKEDENL